MPSANVNYSDIVATTIQSRSGTLADNLTNNVALLRYLKQRGNQRLLVGSSLGELDLTDRRALANLLAVAISAAIG